jgi:hypothetical protein
MTKFHAYKRDKNRDNISPILSRYKLHDSMWLAIHDRWFETNSPQSLT